MKTILSSDTAYVCVFCDTEYTYQPYVCCGEYKGISSVEDVISYYPDLYEMEAENPL